MSDLISRQAAIEALCNDYCGGHQDCKYYPNCENLRSVQKLPSAQPEIVRCKDCQYWNKGSCECPKHAVNCQDYYVGDIETEAEYFCEYAEKREVNHESN